MSQQRQTKSNRWYELRWLDDLGATVAIRRWHRNRLLSLACFAGLVIVGTAVIATHAFLVSSTAAESEKLARENEKLQGLVRQAQVALPLLRASMIGSEATAEKLWAASGLLRNDAILGMGPMGAPSEDVPWLKPIQAQDLDTLWSSEEWQRRLSDLPEHQFRAERILDGVLEHFHDAEMMLSNTPSVRPVNTGMTSSFGKRRDPMKGHWVMHKGIDLGGYIGLEISSAADGVVIFAGWRGGYGKTVVIDHGYGIQTHFAHLDEWLVKPGERVSRGETIARMGSTGKSTGPHLHYEVRRFGQPLDPKDFVLD